MAVMETGTRSRTSKAVKAAAQSAPEQFRELTLPFLPELVGILFEDARDRECVGHRTAVNALLDGLKITGSTDRLLEAILERVNARSEAEMAMAMGMFHAAKDANLADAERMAVQTLRGVLKAEPWKRGRLREAVFGEREIETESTPVLNGHSHEGRTNGTVL